MFWRKNQSVKQEYDPEIQKPVLKCSICNGEQVAGFKNKHTGQFEEVMFIRDPADLDRFLEMYDLKEITKEY